MAQTEADVPNLIAATDAVLSQPRPEELIQLLARHCPPQRPVQLQ